MVASKRGRGAKAQQAKAKAAAAAAEEQQSVAEVEAEPQDAAANNGDSEQMEQSQEDDTAVEAGDDAEAQPEESQEAEQAAGADGEAKPEEKKEEKVESGKILVENLPSSYLFDYQEKLKELFSKHGEIISVKRGPIIVTELTTTPTLSAIVEFKNKDSLEKALGEDGLVLEGQAISVAAESRAETAVLVGVPYEASNDYVRLLFAQCGEVAHIHEFSKTKYKILRVTFQAKESVEKALKLDRELRINGFLVTVSKYRDDDDHKAHNNANKGNNKRQHPQNQGRAPAAASPQSTRNNNNFRPRPPPANNFAPRGNFRGGRGGRGGFVRGGFGRGFAPPANNYMPPQGYMSFQ